MKIINIDYLPPKEALELLEWQSEKEKFDMCTRESELEFIIHYRNSPYRKWLNTSSNTSEWLGFRTFIDNQGNRLKIGYHKLELIGRDRHSSYELNLSYRKSQLRHWFVDRVFEMIEQPYIAKEMATKLIAWRKQREMILTTTRSAVESAIAGQGKLNYIGYGYYEQKDWDKENFNIKIRITTLHDEDLRFLIPYSQVAALVEHLPNILSDLQVLYDLKRGKKLDYYNSDGWNVA